MKTFLLVGAVLSLLMTTVWQIQHISFAFDTSLDSKLHSIRTQVSILVTLAFYIAWRVTPSVK